MDLNQSQCNQASQPYPSRDVSNYYKLFIENSLLEVPNDLKQSFHKMPCTIVVPLWLSSVSLLPEVPLA